MNLNPSNIVWIRPDYNSSPRFPWNKRVPFPFQKATFWGWFLLNFQHATTNTHPFGMAFSVDPSATHDWWGHKDSLIWYSKVYIYIPSLKLTTRTWNTGVGKWVSFWGWPIFRAYVSFREGHMYTYTLHYLTWFLIQYTYFCPITPVERKHQDKTMDPKNKQMTWQLVGQK